LSLPGIDEASARAALDQMTDREVTQALAEAFASGQPTVPLMLAARAVGIRARRTAYLAAERGQLPFRTLLVGGQGRRVVPTAELKALLGLDPAPPAAQAG
jgi:hypothetical protein